MRLVPRLPRRLLTLFHCILAAGLIVQSAAPVVLAQPGDQPLFLPWIANGPARPVAEALFRTHITVRTPAQWRTLAQMGVVILARGGDWASVLVDEAGLEELARRRFNPDRTNGLALLVSANEGRDRTVAGSLAPLLAQAAAAAALPAEEEVQATAMRALRTALASLTAAQQAFLAAAEDVDGDNDGLTDTAEGWWCTDPARADTDFDGVNDGDEVAALKAWMNNELSKAPSTGKPFQGWPHQKANCYDDDSDSVPDAAERLELGLNANRESTDRDKFDDGQELFGNTYCTGGGGFCGYGALPRNEDWGLIFAEMPSWVKAPGHHPLVAAFPVPEIDVVESSLHVETVTTVTTDHTISEGTEKSYSTSKTEGTSTSVANTVNVE
ncbi:MAG: hypothetical protein KatS3mg050_4542 [Litorilinea sp.]|nr:MAG: hypothetical protein KatS3mg050_4542 [Litorilinea sp.]